MGQPYLRHSGDDVVAETVKVFVPDNSIDVPSSTLVIIGEGVYGTEWNQKWDSNDLWTSGEKLNVKVGGIYIITENVSWESGDDTGQRRMYIYVNNVVKAWSFNTGPSGNAGDTLTIMMDLQPDDYVTMKVWQNSGINRYILLNLTTLAIYKIGDIP